MAIPSITVSPGQAARLYRDVDQGGAAGKAGPAGQGGPAEAGNFGAMLGRALDGAVTTGQQADAQSLAAVSGTGNITDVVMAVSKADLALQTTVAIRDRIVQAYQDVMRMPI